MVWKAFEHMESLEDVYVPFKKDRAGNKFGFLKLSNVSNPDDCCAMLKDVRIDGVVIDVSLTKFDRFGSKIEQNKAGVRASVFSRLQPPVHAPSTWRPQGSKPGIQTYTKSYSSVVNPLAQAAFETKIELPPLISDTKRKWEYKSLTGEVKDIVILNDLKTHLSGIMEDGLELRYLGGLKVLLCFDLPEYVEEFHNDKVEAWEKWFSRLYIREGIPPIFERVAWIKVMGVPISLWDRHVFNKVGERCGRLLVQSEVEATDGNMAEDRLAILVNSGKRFSLEFTISWNDHSIKVWVEEIPGQWVPDFLNSSELEFASVSPASSEFGKSPSVSVGESKGPSFETTNSCMDNHNEASSPNVAASMHNVGNNNSPLDYVNEERENEDLDFRVDPAFEQDGGLLSDVNRPNYITTRSKRVTKPKEAAQASNSPDPIRTSVMMNVRTHSIWRKYSD
ncbi:hypothetical protein HanXRQr2_Chr08g0339001 [Helianthus annuus]|uniref:Nucleotide-binding alpha-beta plait domain-containing protein n=1 Tax=Helianthus annuus TaxID=4232 RepID=A0A9K3NCN8_HELAN|nr:hypothetical protein HanXRQr2_Chr08g0339001 [Helianthus annuus]